MCTGKRSMTTEVNFDGRRKPAQLEAVTLRMEEGSFGEVHLACDVLHPAFIPGLWQHTYRCRVACKWSVGECIYLDNGECHKSLLFRIAFPALLRNCCSSVLYDCQEVDLLSCYQALE